VTVRGLTVIGSCLVALLLAFAIALPARADEVVLKSGDSVVGRIVEENEKEVVIETDLGRMRLGRDVIKEIRRGERAGPEETAEGPKRGAKLAWRVSDVAPGIRPVGVGPLLLVVWAKGGVSALDPENGTLKWTALEANTTITGICADSSGAYVATSKGEVMRIDLRAGREGSVMWRTGFRGAVRGAPLLHRRGIFVFVPGRGLYGIDSANGKIRGLLELDLELDTPLASIAGEIAAGDAQGRVLLFGKKGTELPAAVETPGRWNGRELATSLRNLLLASDEKLTVYDPVAGKVVRHLPVPGLLAQPFAGDATRAFVEVDGALTGLNPQTGRILFQATELGRVTHLTVTGTSLLATTADGDLVSISPANGKVNWRTRLRSPGVCAPLLVGGRAVVLTEEGAVEAHVETDEPQPDPPAGAAERGPAPEEAGTRVVHSPDGYSAAVPDSWEVSEDVTRGTVSIGLRPRADAERFAGAEELARRSLELTGKLAVLVTPMTEETAQELGLRYLENERREAKEAGYETEKRTVKTVTVGEEKWDQVSLEQIYAEATESKEVEGETIPAEKRFLKRAFFRSLDSKRRIWVELRCPIEFAEAAAKDLEALTASIFPEADSFTPSAEVQVAERVLGALNETDLEATMPHLSDPLRERTQSRPPVVGRRRYRLLDRTSEPIGKFRELRVRIDQGDQTGYASLLLAREQNRFVVVEWLHLFK